MIALSYSLETGAPSNWQLVAPSPFPAGEVLIGVAVTSHVDGQLATGTFDNLMVNGSVAP